MRPALCGRALANPKCAVETRALVFCPALALEERCAPRSNSRLGLMRRKLGRPERAVETRAPVFHTAARRLSRTDSVVAASERYSCACPNSRLGLMRRSLGRPERAVETRAPVFCPALALEGRCAPRSNSCLGLMRRNLGRPERAVETRALVFHTAARRLSRTDSAVAALRDAHALVRTRALLRERAVMAPEASSGVPVQRLLRHAQNREENTL